jgi:hypothetical protein
VFSLPIIIAVLFSAWFSLGGARTYRSTATLWVDNGPAEGSSLYTMAAAAAAASIGNYSATEGPANFEQQILGEMLQTPTFDVAVAKASSLPGFYASGAKTGFSPAVLLNRPNGPPVYQAAASVAAGAKTATRGPQVLELSYTGPTPALAQNVLASLITQTERAAPAYSNDFARQEQTFFQEANDSAARAQANAQASLAVYKRQHPYATARTDTIYAALAQSLKTTKTALTSTTAAVQSFQGPGPGMKATISLIDKPSLPDGPTVSTSDAAVGVLGGLFAGLLISFLAVFMATPDSHERWDSELSNARWLRVGWTPRGEPRARRGGPGTETRGVA